MFWIVVHLESGNNTAASLNVCSVPTPLKQYRILSRTASTWPGRSFSTSWWPAERWSSLSPVWTSPMHRYRVLSVTLNIEKDSNQHCFLTLCLITWLCSLKGTKQYEVSPPGWLAVDCRCGEHHRAHRGWGRLTSRSGIPLHSFVFFWIKS